MDVSTTWHRHELFGISPHAVLADVKTVDLVAVAGAQAPGVFDGKEDGEAEDEHGGEADAHRQRLGAELVEAVRVDQAALADVVELGEDGIAEQAARQRAPDAGETVSAERADRVVDDLV